MMKYDISLFNEADKHLLRQRVNQALKMTHQSFQLAVADIEQVLDGRKQAMLDNHLIDFSLNNTQHFMEQVARSQRMSKSEYLTIVEVLQDCFYYLHSLQLAEDEALWEIIWTLYEKFAGNLEYLQGAIEDFPSFKEDE